VPDGTVHPVTHYKHTGAAMERKATIHDATGQKHGAVRGSLYVVAIFEGRRIIDTHEAESAAEGVEWARATYGLATAEGC
jgi:hypothetical protein